MDTTDSGRITFTVKIFSNKFVENISNVQDFVRTLSVLEKGSLLERMTWIARLYDLDGDGYIARDDLEDIIFSVGTIVIGSIVVEFYYSISETEIVLSLRREKIRIQFTSYVLYFSCSTSFSYEVRSVSNTALL